LEVDITDLDKYTQVEVDTNIGAAITTHEGSPDPHPQYLTPDDLPATIVSWFTDDVSSIDGAFLQSVQNQPATPETTLQATGNTTGVPELLGQWMRETLFTSPFTWYETSSVYQLDLDADNANAELWTTVYIRRANTTLVPLATSDRIALTTDRRTYTLPVQIAGPIEVEAGDTVQTEIWINKIGGADPTVTLYMEGNDISRSVTSTPIATYPENHAVSHEVAGADQITHDNLSGAQGYKSHATIDTDIGNLQTGKSDTNHTHLEVDITDLDKYTQLEIDGLLTGKSDTSHTHLEVDITDLDKYTQAETDLLVNDKMEWRNEWQPIEYYKNDTVKDGTWTMVANKTTTERAGPQETGDPFYVYSGTLLDEQVSAKQILYGQRYIFNQGGYLKGYRIYTTLGIHYSLFSVTDPLGTPVVKEQTSFTASTTGWFELSVPPILVGNAAALDLVISVSESDPSPATFSGDWDYSIPNNSVAPIAGQVVHATKDLGNLLISKTDDAAGDRTSELAALTVGDIIATDVRYTIQSIVDSGTYYTFGVTPQTQGTAGVKDFTYETIIATPIDYGREVDYFAANADISGLYIADGAYGDIAVNNNAYGIDILVQNATIPNDWDVLASSASTSSSEGGGGGATSLAGLTDVDPALAPTEGQILTYDNTNSYFIASEPASTELVNDLTPQLGGDLDVNGKKMTIANMQTGSEFLWNDANTGVDLMALKFNGSLVELSLNEGGGNAVLSGVTTPVNATDAANKNYVDSLDTGISSVVEDTTPQLGGNLDLNTKEIVIGAGQSLLSAGPDVILATDTGSVRIVTQANAPTNLVASGLNGLTYPAADGTADQVITTDGLGNLTFADASGGIGSVADDLTPQLGGDLDAQDNNITSVNTLYFGPNSTGEVPAITLDTNTSNLWLKPSVTGTDGVYISTDGLHNGTGYRLPLADGTDEQVMTTNGLGTVIFKDLPSGELANDISPQLGGDLDVNDKSIIPGANKRVVVDLGDVVADNTRTFAIKGAGSDLITYSYDGTQLNVTDLGNVVRYKQTYQATTDDDLVNKAYFDANAGGGNTPNLMSLDMGTFASNNATMDAGTFI
ncbi:MAG: hypothetical protein DRP93_05895, partial [Candidatus Neomarinimicrobiota bacterium]